MDKLRQWIKTLASDRRKQRSALLVVAALAAALLFFCDALPRSGTQTPQTVSVQEYQTMLENKLKQTVESISGAGDATVIITLKGSFQSVYASSDRQSSTLEASGDRTSRQNSSESDPAIIGRSGGDSPLLVTEIYPDINGVVGVCRGARDEAVRERIVLAVKAALGISAADVYVTY